jgi:formamidopyrimidine-DNA glycosylase
MPELPDLIVYRDALARRFTGQPLLAVRVTSPFVLRTVEPPPRALEGLRVTGFHLIGKRLVFAFDGDFFLLVHLMIAGRLHLKRAGAAIPARLGLAALDFPGARLMLTEASSRKRAALHVVRGEAALAAFDLGGLDVLAADLPAFTAAITRENRTLKRALTDPRIVSGIGNAYSDEILHRARLSPFALTRKLEPPDVGRLFESTQTVLREWIARLRAETADGFPEKVTAFRDQMAVHGRYRLPCPVCGAPVQRIVYAENEANYCATCQTGGRLLADRALSRLMRDDWPRTLEELEERKSGGSG